MRDSQGVYSAYAHLEDIPAKWSVGSTVTRGDVIAQSGNTGSPSACGVSSIGYHVHLSIAYRWDVTTWGGGWTTAKFTDPEVYIQKHS